MYCCDKIGIIKTYVPNSTWRRADIFEEKVSQSQHPISKLGEQPLCQQEQIIIIHSCVCSRWRPNHGRSCVSWVSTQSGQRLRVWSFSYSLVLARSCVFSFPTLVSSLWQSLLCLRHQTRPTLLIVLHLMRVTFNVHRDRCAPSFPPIPPGAYSSRSLSSWRRPRRIREACVSVCTQPAPITTIQSFHFFPMILCERLVPKCASGTFMNLTSEELSTVSAIRKWESLYRELSAWYQRYQFQTKTRSLSKGGSLKVVIKTIACVQV